jgi:hypothetical protein
MANLLIDNKEFRIGGYVKREYTRSKYNKGIITNIFHEYEFGSAPCLEVLTSDGSHIDYYF